MDNARKGTSRLPFLAAALLLMAAAGPAAGQDQGPLLVDRIVAIVDEEAILLSDLDREVELYRMDREYQGQEIPADLTEVRGELLQRLIESKLIIAAAKQADMTVDEDAISQSVEEKIQQFIEHFGSLENLEGELRKNGMTLDDYRARMRSQLRDQQYLRLVVGKFIRPDVEVLENEVRDYYLAHLDEMPADPDSLTIADILVTVQPSLAVRQAVQEEVTAIQQALAAGRDFSDVAREHSRGPEASRGGSIGSFGPGELFDPALNNAAFKLPAGQVSEPIVSARGVHLVRVDGVEEDGRRTLSQIFLPIPVTQEDIDRAGLKIRAAQERVIAGEAFSLVAAEVSEDPGSARNGGVLGTFSLEDLSSQFQEVLKDAQPGTVSDPVLTPAGWYVFKILDRTPGHMYNFDELKENLRQVVENEKIEAALAEYVEGLRARFFIDLKG